MRDSSPDLTGRAGRHTETRVEDTYTIDVRVPCEEPCKDKDSYDRWHGKDGRYGDKDKCDRDDDCDRHDKYDKHDKYGGRDKDKCRDEHDDRDKTREPIDDSRDQVEQEPRAGAEVTTSLGLGELAVRVVLVVSSGGGGHRACDRPEPSTDDNGNRRGPE